MIIHEVAQGTSAWLAVRAGKPTASNFSRVMTPSGNKSDGWYPYMNQLLAERMLGKPLEGFESEWMARGSEFEQKAVDSYEFSHDCDTEQIGFVTTDDGLIGCSPDRFIKQFPEGQLQVKCPKPETHVAYLLNSIGAGKAYKVQCHGEMLVCEKKWTDVLSFHPEMPEALYRMEADPVFLDELEAMVRAFSTELELKAMECKERGWIKELEVPKAEENPFLTAEDIAWARDRFKGETNAK